MPNVASTRGQPVYTPPSPIADLLRLHREAMRVIYANHRAQLDTWTTALLPQRKNRAA
jgi:hypothetical protein